MTAIAEAAALLSDLLVVTPATRTTSTTSAGVDVLNYDGLARFQLVSAKGSGNADNTLDVKLQESDTSGGTYTDISGASFPQVLGSGGSDVSSGIVVDLKTTKRWIRANWTVAGTTPSYVFGITATPLQKYR